MLPAQATLSPNEAFLKRLESPVGAKKAPAFRGGALDRDLAKPKLATIKSGVPADAADVAQAVAAGREARREARGGERAAEDSLSRFAGAADDSAARTERNVRSALASREMADRERTRSDLPTAGDVEAVRKRRDGSLDGI